MFTVKSVLTTITIAAAAAKAVIALVDQIGKLQDKSTAKAT